MRHFNIHSLLQSCFYLLTLAFIACQSEVEEVSEMQFVNGNEVVSGNAETRSIICEVTTTAAGQLIEKLEEFGAENGCTKEEITELTISGPVNREDLQALQPFEKITKLDMREMTIIDEWGNETSEFPSQSLENFASPAYVYTPNSAYIIRSYAFYNSNIIGVYMHDNTELLDTDSFRDCKMLTDVRLSDKLEDFGSGIFQGCSSLTSIELPPTLKTIRVDMFAGCGFTTFTIPETITNIEHGAFQSCKNLETINWPSEINRVPNWCFYYCEKLQITLPEGVTEIGLCAFEGCASITSFSFPKTITNIEQGAFRACKNLETINWPANLTIIPSECFYECTNLQFEIPEYITEIGSYAFAGCTSITSFSLPKTITNIYASAFQSCENLETINWPASITKIPNSCFNGCSKLQIEIPEGVTDIGQSAFHSCNDIISLPSTLMSIESYAFENCQGITSLTIPPSVTKWGENVFCNCVNLVTVTGLEEYEVIPKGMFLFCFSLENITLNKVVTIGTDAFSYCESMQNISLPNTLKEIGDAAFHDCISFTEIVLPEGLEKIGFRAFRNTRISEITFPASLKEVGEGVLEYTGSALKVVYWNCPIEIPRLREKWEGTIPYIYSVPGVAYDKNNGTNVIFGNDESGYVADRFYISGDQDFYCPKAFTAKQVLYRKSFGKGTNPDEISSGWETISLPFTASKFIVQDNGVQPERVLKPFGSDDMGDAKPFWLRAYTENGFERATTLEAGKPYIIAFPNNSNLYLPEYNIWGMIEFWGENVSIMPSSEEVTPVTGPDFTMYPTFSFLADMENIYQISGTWLDNGKGGSVWGEAFVLGTSWVDRFTAYGVANGTSRSVIPIGGNGKSNTRSSVGEGGIPQENDI